jgi:CRP-like cAMP-binding protein
LRQASEFENGIGTRTGKTEATGPGSMSLQNECDMLQSIPLFRDVDQANRKLVAMSSDRVIYQPGDTIFAQGETSNAVYFVLTGRVKIIRQDNETAVEIAELANGSILGETAVLCGKARNASAFAAAETVLLRLQSNVFAELLEHMPQVTLGLARELAARIDATNARLHEASAI